MLPASALLVPVLALAPPQVRLSDRIEPLEFVAPGDLRLHKDYVVGQLLMPGDIDGNGADDLYLVRTKVRMCGNEQVFAAIDVLSGGRHPVGMPEIIRAAPILDRAAFGSQERLLRLYVEPRHPSPALEVRSLDGFTLHWSLPSGTLPIGDAYEGCFLPALDGSAAPDVIVANAWARPDGGDADDGGGHGAVARLSGVDGATLWVPWANAPAQAYGRHVAPAGDVDGDGTNDLVVCMPDLRPNQPLAAHRRPYLEFLSGADGSVLALRLLEPANVESFRAVGDLDGDGRADFVVQTSEPARGEGPPTSLLLSGSREPLQVQPEREVLWFTPWRDDAGAPALLVGLRERGATTSGTPEADSLWIVSPQTSARFADYPAGISPRIDQVTAGDFDGDGVADLALVQRGPRAGVGYSHRLTVVPGSGLR